MKNYFNLFIISLLFFLLSCDKDVNEDSPKDPVFSEDQLIGKWEGILKQSGVPDFHIKIEIKNVLLESAESGTGEYDAPKCTISWRYLGPSADKSSYLFKESIVDQFGVFPNVCAPGTVNLKFKDEDNLFINWIGDDAPGFNFANGSMERK